MRLSKKTDSRNGNSLVEFALVLPMLLILIANVVNFGGFFFAWITVANAARAGAEHMATGSSSLGSPPIAKIAEITPVIAADVYSLPNKASVVIRVCMRWPANNAIASLWDDQTQPCPAGFSNPPVDSRPEGGKYITGWVDVRYTYQPFIPQGFQFPGLSLFTTLLPTSIHRQAVMRLT